MAWLEMPQESFAGGLNCQCGLVIMNKFLNHGLAAQSAEHHAHQTRKERSEIMKLMLGILIGSITTTLSSPASQGWQVAYVCCWIALLILIIRECEPKRDKE